jgi:hypothetical protein
MLDGEFQNIEFIDTDILHLFYRVEQEVCKGYRLLTHPLTGSIRPDITPYKSVLLSERGGELDRESIELIQKAIDYAYELETNHARPDWGINEQLDFQFVDRGFIRNALAINQ